jgi:hypothetical protein
MSICWHCMEIMPYGDQHMAGQNEPVLAARELV